MAAPLPQPPPKPSMESLLYEARSRIIWGEEPARVAAWLREQKVEPHRIADILKSAQAERADIIRKKGIDEVFMGVTSLVLSALLLVVMWNYITGRGQVGPYLGFVGLVGVYGIFCIARGLNWIYSGASLRGSVTDMED